MSGSASRTATILAELSLAEGRTMLDHRDGHIEAARARRAAAAGTAVGCDSGPLPARNEDVAFAPAALLSRRITRGDVASRR